MAKIEALEQAKNFFQNLSRTQKIIIGGGALAVLIAVVSIIFMSSSKQEETGALYTNLNPQDASKIVDKLKEKQIDYELKDNGSTIVVDKKVIHETRLDLAKEGLPESGVVGYEIFDKTNLGMSEFVQKLNYRRALEGELARTIGSLDEVQKVRVHLVIPEKALFEKDQKQPTASITLHLKSGRSLSKLSVEGIQNLVASSVEGMQPSSVSVVDQRGRILSPPPVDDQSVAGKTSLQHEQQRKVEQYLTRKVQSLLDGVLGTDNSEVRVNAELDFDQKTETSTNYDPEGQVVRSEQTITDNSSSTDTVTYPTMNMEQSQENKQVSVQYYAKKPVVNNAKNQSNSIINYELSKTVKQFVGEVGSIKRLSVSVLVNGNLKVVEDKDGAKTLQYIPRSEEEIEKLTQIVKNAVGYDSTRNDQISLYDYPFDTQIMEKELEDYYEPPWYKKPENIKLLVFIAAMILVIFLIYRLLQSKQVKERFRIAFQLPERVAVDEEELEDDEEEELDEEEALEELDLMDEDELMPLPAELPETLLLEGDREEMEMEEMEGGEAGEGFDKESLAERARAQLEEGEPVELSEEAMMKLEIKEKVQEFIDDQPIEAVKLVRLFIQQDIEKGIF